MAVTYAHLAQDVSFVIATGCYICRQVLQVVARRDAYCNAGNNFEEQIEKARALAARLEQSITIQHEGPLDEYDDQCLRVLATLVRDAKVICAPCCPAPAEASVGALPVGCWL